MDFGLTKMSSKGQVVIPADLRVDMVEGDKLIIIRKDDTIILKKSIEKNFEEDMRFAKKTEDAWKKYEKGQMKKMEFDEFVEESKKW